MSDEKSSCGHMDIHPQNDWGTVRYDCRFDVYWMPAGSAKQALFYCPWCGEKLPSSQRDRWFDELEAAGIDPTTDPIPELYSTGAWRGAPDIRAPLHHQGNIEGRYIDFFDLPDEPTNEDLAAATVSLPERQELFGRAESLPYPSSSPRT